VSGRFAARMPSADGDTVTLGLVGPGETFGELVLLDAGRRFAGRGLLSLARGRIMVRDVEALAALSR
jgi:CRP-like cAMP-binding protein